MNITVVTFNYISIIEHIVDMGGNFLVVYTQHYSTFSLSIGPYSNVSCISHICLAVTSCRQGITLQICTSHWIKKLHKQSRIRPMVKIVTRCAKSHIGTIQLHKMLLPACRKCFYWIYHTSIDSTD